MAPARRALLWALLLSLLLHAAFLLVPQREPAASRPAATRLEASLGLRLQVAEPTPALAPKKAAPGKAAKPARSRILSVDKSGGPAVAAGRQWSAAEKAEMDSFLDELAGQAKAVPKPTLAQRSLAMAREQGRQMAQQDEAGSATLERRPNGPPVDPFSLEAYIDGLVRRLNRSAGFVRNDPRSKGVRPAAVQFRLNPDGSLKSFVVLNAGDQADEIAFIKAVVERAIPFSPFPPDIDRAARSLGVVICIQPGSGSGFGFSRTTGRGC
ncbi:hypothetical protein [Dechloromonas sp. A34]|uniref:hypothetical protein n=1 Tax=Dechloromonas sp. A34 TaxID=447588 RepID=UPI002248B02A|nr:hypothetical protein [Dechloromonas sp. A34]